MGTQPDVVVIGAGVMGCSAAYWLSKAGLKVVVLEKDAIGAGASGMAAALWQAAGRAAGATLNADLAHLCKLGFQVQRHLAKVLQQESGRDIGYREHPSIQVAFTVAEAETLMSDVQSLASDDPTVSYLEGDGLRQLEPRLNHAIVGGAVSHQAQVVAGRYVVALAQAAERYGAELRSGAVVRLERSGSQVGDVVLRNGTRIAAEVVVVATGPWAGEAASWLGIQIPVYPVRGQLLELEVPDAQLQTTLAHGHTYVAHKADGWTLAGTTEEHDSGFVNRTTPAGLEAIMDGILGLAPSLEEARVAHHIAGLRPGSRDGMPMIGAVPGLTGAYLLAGHFRKGIVLSGICGQIVAELITKGKSSVRIEAFDPGRFGPAV